MRNRRRPFLPGASPVFGSTSLGIRMSSACSATIFLSSLFSRFSSLSRLSWLSSSPPNLLFHRNTWAPLCRYPVGYRPPDCLLRPRAKSAGFLLRCIASSWFRFGFILLQNSLSIRFSFVGSGQCTDLTRVGCTYSSADNKSPSKKCYPAGILVNRRSVHLRAKYVCDGFSAIPLLPALISRLTSRIFSKFGSASCSHINSMKSRQTGQLQNLMLRLHCFE